MRKLFFYLFVFVCVILGGCKKSNNNATTTSSNAVSVIQNSIYANAVDTLQAIYNDSVYNVTYYYYGSFDNTGVPLQIKSVAIKHMDTIMNMIFDDSMRVVRAFVVINNVPDTTIMTFNYGYDSVTLLTSIINNVTGNVTLRNITLVSTVSNPYTVLSSTNFRTTQTTNFITNIISAHVAIVTATTVIFDALTLGASTLSSYLPSVVAGGTIGKSVNNTPPASSDVISDYPKISFGEPTQYSPHYLDLVVGEYDKGYQIGYLLKPGDPGYDPSVQHGLMIWYFCCPAGITWGTYGILVGTDTAFGTGKANTNAIISRCGNNTLAYVCSSLTIGPHNYNDWYMPSLHELRVILQNYDALLLMSDTRTNDFIPSSESSAFSFYFMSLNPPSYIGTSDTEYNGKAENASPPSPYPNVLAVRNF